MADGKKLQAKKKQEASALAELTNPGVVFTPDVDIVENQREIRVLADMPGIDPDNIEIDLRDSVLTLSGAVKPIQEDQEVDILVEFETGRYHRQFSLSEVIDQEKIKADLDDGVLRLVLPKSDKAVPRKIEVTAT